MLVTTRSSPIATSARSTGRDLATCVNLSLIRPGCSVAAFALYPPIEDALGHLGREDVDGHDRAEHSDK